MQLKNKLILIFLFFGIFLIFNSKVFATEDVTINLSSVNYPNKTLSDLVIPSTVLDNSSISNETFSEYKYLIFNFGKGNSSDSIYFVFSKTPFFISSNDGVSFVTPSYISSSYNYSNNYWSMRLQESSDGSNLRVGDFNLNSYSSSTPIISNSIIYTDSTFETEYTGSKVTVNEDFFQLTPPAEEVPSLAEVVAQGHQQAKEITQESLEVELAELVPVGIVIMASLILVSLIAYFRFWKG